MKNSDYDDDSDEMDSSDDFIENEDELIKEEGRGFIVDEDEDEEDDDIPKRSSKKTSHKGKDVDEDEDDDDDDDNYEEEDEEDLMEEVEDLIGNSRKRRLVRDSDDDDDDDFDYPKEKRSRFLPKAVPKVVPKMPSKSSQQIKSRPQHSLQSKKISKPNIPSSHSGSEEEFGNENELENEDFENEDRSKFVQKTSSKNFSNLKSKRLPTPDLGSEEEIENEDQENVNENEDEFGNEENEYDEDDLDDFIVDSHKKKKRYDGNEDADVILNTRQEKEAMDLFGCDTADLENLDADNDYSDLENEDIDHSEVFNLEDLERGFHTKQDEIIRKTDLPERFQLKGLCIEDITENDDSLRSEAKLLYDELFNERSWDKITTCHLLVKILHMIRSKCYEIPYIYLYERDEITEKEIDFSIDDLWNIFDYHLKWKAFSIRKSKLLQSFDSIDEIISREEKKPFDLISAIRVVIENIKNVNEARLIDELLCFNFTDQYKTVVSANTRLVNKFRMEKTVNIDKMISFFGMESYKYSINVKENYMLNKIKDNEVLPEEIAKSFICTRFPTSEKVLQSARNMFAYQISKEIAINNYVFDYFKKYAKIKIRPTSTGCSMIDQKHELYKYKYITDKPIIDFQNNYDYLHIYQSEHDKLLTTSIYLLENDKESLSNHLFSLFNNDEFNKIATAWNHQRKMIIEELTQSILIPEAVKKTHQNLSEMAQQKLAREIGGVLKRNINIRPYVNTSGEASTIILGISYQNENSAAVVINEIGAVIRSVNLKNLMNNSKSRNNKDLKRSDIDKIINLIATHRICTIAITGTCKSSLYLETDLINAIKHADKELNIPHVEVEILNCDFSKAYEASTISKLLYPQLNTLQRQAVGVALNLLDPLIAYSHLMNYDKDIKKIRFHIHTSLVNEDILLTQYERQFMEVVSKTGVDINNCLKHKNYQFILQFVAGLGPRKAKQLIEKIIKKCHKYYENHRGTYVEDAELLLTNRVDLISKKYLGCIVARNCAPFLKISNASHYDDGNILDETRINPMDYDFAIKIAQNILDMEEHPENAQLALKTVINDTDLSDLDFKSFADSIYERNNIKKHLIIQQINDELMNPFHDNRSSFIHLSDKEKFYLLTNEHEKELKIGAIVEFRVVKFDYRKNTKDFDNAKPKRNERTGYFSCPICDKADFTELNEIWTHFDNDCRGKIVGANLIMSDNEISAFVSIRNIADKFVRNISDFLKIDQLVIGVVTKIDFHKMQLEVSLKESEITKAKNTIENFRDNYYDEIAEKNENLKNQQLSKTNLANINLRISFHPNFQNITYQEFEKKSNYLQNGDFIIRPSSKGKNRLTISWKISNDLFRHIDVLEEKKENENSIGKVLIIESEKYDDLDDVITNYLQPMINYTDDVFNYKYFKNIKAEDKHKLEAMIIKEKKSNPQRIPYYIVPIYKYPGGFMFVFLPNNKVLYDSFLVTHQGYRFGNSVFQNINRLIDNFKSHCQPNTLKKPLHPINENLQMYKKHSR